MIALWRVWRKKQIDFSLRDARCGVASLSRGSRILASAFFLLLPFFFALPLAAQPENIRFDHIGTENGLSQSNAICIFQDSRGFIWIGTRDGLNKYDGYKITVYRNIVGDTLSISNNVINDIAEDSDGNLWIATWGGINKFDRKKEIFTCYKHIPGKKGTLSLNLINTLFIDDDEKIWVGLEGTGLDFYDP